MTPYRVLVTGASGFVGRYLADDLAARGYAVRAASRGLLHLSNPSIEHVTLPDLARPFQAAALVANIDAIVHCAGLAHTSADIGEAAYMAINTDATRSLAEAAREAGVRHFIFLSSVRAQSGPSAAGAVTEKTPAAPSDAYGRSKLAAERSLSETLGPSPTRWTALRPVLIYGPGVKANMSGLMALARQSLPLPLAGLSGRRSLLSIDNLCHAVRHVLEMQPAESATYLVADSEPVTVAQIVTALRRGLGRSSGLFRVPNGAVMAALHLTGRREMAERLFGDLVVDTGRLRQTGWQPLKSTADALAELMARGG